MRYTGNSATGIDTQTLFIFVARSHHCHQALAINNASNDSLANLIVLWTLTYPVLLVKALRLLIQLRNGRWVTDLCPTLLQSCSNHIYFISIGILIHENLGLDTKITFVLQLEQKLWQIYQNKVRNWRPSLIFNVFHPFRHMIMVCHAV